MAGHFDVLVNSVNHFNNAYIVNHCLYLFGCIGTTN